MKGRFLFPFGVFAVAAFTTGCETEAERKAAADRAAKARQEQQRELARATGQMMGSMLQGVGGELLDAKNQAGTVDGTTSVELSSQGVNLQRAKIANLGLGDSIDAYVVFDQPFSGSLELRVTDKDNREVGRSKMNHSVTEPSAEYVTFRFDERAPLSEGTKVELR